MKNIIITFLLALGIWSCGSRKVETKIEKKEVKTENNILKESETKTEFEKKDEVNTNVKEVTNEIESVVEPVDPTKEMIVNGKSYINAKLTTKKSNNVKDTQEQKVTTEKFKESKKEKEVDKSKSSISEKSKTKKVDRKESFIFSLWFWLILIIILLILYWLYNKYKDKILFFLNKNVV